MRLRAVHAIARIVEQGHPSSDGHAERVADLASSLARALGLGAGAGARAARGRRCCTTSARSSCRSSVLLKPTAVRRGRVGADAPATRSSATTCSKACCRSGSAPGCAATTSAGTAAATPTRLAGEAIPEGARILAVADSWDVMTSARVYSGALRARRRARRGPPLRRPAVRPRRGDGARRPPGREARAAAARGRRHGGARLKAEPARGPSPPEGRARLRAEPA